MDENHFISLLFTPLEQRGEPEPSICRVIKGSKSYTTTSPLSALQMKASDSCKILVKIGLLLPKG